MLRHTSKSVLCGQSHHLDAYISDAGKFKII